MKTETKQGELPPGDQAVLTLTIGRSSTAIETQQELRMSELMAAAEKGIVSCLKIAHAVATAKGLNPDMVALGLLERSVASATRQAAIDIGIVNKAGA